MVGSGSSVEDESSLSGRPRPHRRSVPEFEDALNGLHASRGFSSHDRGLPAGLITTTFIHIAKKCLQAPTDTACPGARHAP